MIPLATAKAHLKVLHSRDDSLIQSSISAALTMFEDFTGRKLYANQTDLDADTDAPENTQVINDAILYGALFMIGYLYSVRDVDAPMPRATKALWQPYRVIRVA